MKNQIFKVGNQIKLRVNQQIYFGNLEDVAEWCFVHFSPAGTHFTLCFNYNKQGAFYFITFCSVYASLFRLMLNYELIVTPIRCFPVFMKCKHTNCMHVLTCECAHTHGIRINPVKIGDTSLVISILSNKFLFSCAVVMLNRRNKSWIAYTSPSTVLPP